jgi:NADH:ubiquinone oxidoreductase subunit 5 (subunit L)/multisubunit Na+/H+ antiporter MnhA subunit
MPVTAFTFIIGWLAIAGVPPFSGFWSKDEILAFAWDDSPALWFVGFVTAVLTAFYMSRQVFMTFFGRYRYGDVRASEIEAVWSDRVTAADADLNAATSAVTAAETSTVEAREALARSESQRSQREAEMAAFDPTDEAARETATKNLDAARVAVDQAEETLAAAETDVEAARAVLAEARGRVDSVVAAAATARPSETISLFEAPTFDGIEAADLPDAARRRREYHPHESPWLMTVPLVVLALLAGVAGVLNLPFTSDLHLLEHWLEPSLFGNEVHLGLSAAGKWLLAIVAVVGAAAGIVAAVGIYLLGRRDPSMVEKPILADAWRYDRMVAAFMGGPGRKGFDLVAWFDAQIVDGAVEGVGRLVRAGGGRLRHLQTGLVRTYAAGVGVGAVLLLAWFLVRADF